jgi:exoribonuclease R
MKSFPFLHAELPLSSFLQITPSCSFSHFLVFLNSVENRYVGHIDPSSVPPTASTSRTPTTVFLLPLTPLIPKIRLRTRRPHSLLNQRILVTIDVWEPSSRYPEGHFIRALGKIESREAETEALLIEWDVVYRGFSERVLRCLPEEGHAWRVPERLAEGRRDFRDRDVCSIDPPCMSPSPLFSLSLSPLSFYLLFLNI